MHALFSSCKNEWLNLSSLKSHMIDWCLLVQRKQCRSFVHYMLVYGLVIFWKEIWCADQTKHSSKHAVFTCRNGKCLILKYRHKWNINKNTTSFLIVNLVCLHRQDTMPMRCIVKMHLAHPIPWITYLKSPGVIETREISGSGWSQIAKFLTRRTL